MERIGNELTVTGLSCLAHAELEINRGVTLLAGMNAGGKSSILRALASLLSAERNPITGFVKADALAMVQRIPVYRFPDDPNLPPEIVRYDGPKEATAEVAHGKFHRRIVWKASGTSEITGTADPDAVMPRIATGLVRYSGLNASERYDLLSGILGVAPTLDDLKKACPAATGGMLDKLTELVDRGDWTEVAAHRRGGAPQRPA